MLGLATAVVLGFLLYWGGIRLNLGVFFKWTSLFILLVAAGLAAGRSAPSTKRAVEPLPGCGV
jgi:high-affinity iron transporter